MAARDEHESGEKEGQSEASESDEANTGDVREECESNGDSENEDTADEANGKRGTASGVRWGWGTGGWRT